MDDELSTEGVDDEIAQLATMGANRVTEPNSSEAHEATARALLALVPDDFWLDSQKQWVGLGRRISNVPIADSYTRTKHIIRSSTGLFRHADTFVADVIINDMCDRGCSAYKPHAERSATGDAVVKLMVEGPTIIRRLLARIDELEGRSAPGLD